MGPIVLSLILFLPALTLVSIQIPGRGGGGPAREVVAEIWSECSEGPAGVGAPEQLLTARSAAQRSATASSGADKRKRWSSRSGRRRSGESSSCSHGREVAATALALAAAAATLG